MSTAVAPSPAVAEPQWAALRRTLAPLTIEPLHLVSLLLCCVVFGGWLLTGTARLPVLAVFFFALLTVTSYYLGRLVLHAAPLPDGLSLSFPLTFLVGSLTWALLMFGLHSLLPGSLRVHSVCLGLLAAVGQLVRFRRLPPGCEERSAARVSLFVVVFSLAAGTCWARGLLHSEQLVGDQVEFRHWRDYFDHTAFTAPLLSREHLWAYGDKEVSHLPTPLYHYGSYLAPATLASFGRLAAYQVVVAFWTPFGTFLSGLAAYALAASLGRRVAGVCGTVALLALPDSSYYGLHNGWFRYHWLQQIGSAGLYGTAAAALALLFLVEARRSRSRAALVLAAAFTGATFFFKAQIFVVLVPLLVAWFILTHPRLSLSGRVLLLQGLVVLALAGVLASNHWHLGPRLEPNLHYFEQYCQYAASESQPCELRTFVEGGAAAAGRSRFYLAGTTLLVLAPFGGLLAGVPALCLWAWWKKRLHALDLAPWLAVGVYALLAVGLDDSTVGISLWELIHRPFVWAYFVVMVWCAAKFAVLAADTRGLQWLMNPKLVGAAGLLLLPLPWHMGLNIQAGKTLWSWQDSNFRVPRGLVACGRHVAHTGSRADVVQDSQTDGLTLAFGALCERRSYLARPWLWRASKNPAVPPEVERRLAVLERLKTAATVEELRELAALTGIRWYLLHPEDRVGWPEAVRDNPAFTADGFALYDLSGLAER